MGKLELITCKSIDISSAYLLCQRDFANDRSSICIVADVDLQLEFGQSERKSSKIFISKSTHKMFVSSHFVVHPTKPFSRNLGTIIIHMNVFGIFYPSIAAIEIIVILIVFVTIFIRTDQSTNFQVIMSEMSKTKLIPVCLLSLFEYSIIT